MGRYLTSRLAQFVPTLLLVSMVVFGMVRAIPGDAARVLLGPQAKPEQIAALRERMGLDQPLVAQYGRWVAAVLRGDFGKSWINGYPVAELIGQRLVATLTLACGALLIGLLVAIPLGITAALRAGTWVDRVISLYNGVVLGIPTFWLGILLVLIFSLRLTWLPPSGYVPIRDDPIQALRMLALPGTTLGLYLSAVFARFLKAAILDVLRQDYVRTATAKGLTGRVIVSRHVLRNAAIPLVTVLGVQLGGLISGAVIVESIFAWPGIGRLLVTSIATRDYAVVQAIILVSTVAFLVVNLATDLVYGVLDPRIRVS